MLWSRTSEWLRWCCYRSQRFRRRSGRARSRAVLGSYKARRPGTAVSTAAARWSCMLYVGLYTVDISTVRGELGGLSESELVFSPGGGVEFDVVEPVAVRVVGEWSSRELLRERIHNTSAFVELVLRVGKRCVTAAC